MVRGMIVALLLSLPAAAYPPPKPAGKKSEQELIVGVWKRTETTQMDPNDLFLWFDDKGGMYVGRKLDKSGWGYKAKYEIKDKELPYESVDPGFPNQKETLKVLKLTEDELEYEDPAGIREKYKRVVEPEKKDEPPVKK
jgi:uncharacterized protein (TIGR03066 family)